MLGMITTGKSGLNGYKNRILLLEVTGMKGHESIRTSHYTIAVPYARLSQEMQRIQRMGGQIASVKLQPPLEVIEREWPTTHPSVITESPSTHEMDADVAVAPPPSSNPTLETTPETSEVVETLATEITPETSEVVEAPATEVVEAPAAEITPETSEVVEAPAAEITPDVPDIQPSQPTPPETVKDLPVVEILEPKEEAPAAQPSQPAPPETVQEEAASEPVKAKLEEPAAEPVAEMPATEVDANTLNPEKPTTTRKTTKSQSSTTKTTRAKKTTKSTKSKKGKK